MYKQAFLFIFFLVTPLESDATEIKAGKFYESIVLSDNGREITYKGITGNKNGLTRNLTTINGFPALSVIGRDIFYYTLSVADDKILMDCAYSDARNIYNGARVYAGVCGLKAELTDNYDELAQRYSNEWRESIFSFDTHSIFEKNIPTDFFLGKIGSIEVYDRYTSIEALKNSAPQKYIKSSSGCFNFKDAIGFLVFTNVDQYDPQYLDIFNSNPTKSFHRLLEHDLNKLAIENCE